MQILCNKDTSLFYEEIWGLRKMGTGKEAACLQMEVGKEAVSLKT